MRAGEAIEKETTDMDSDTSKRVTRTVGRLAVLIAGLWLLGMGRGDGVQVIAWLGGILILFASVCLMGGE